MLFQNVHHIRDSGFVKQVERSLEKTGEVPEGIRISLNIPYEHAVAFLKRFEEDRIFLKDGSKVGKSELVGLLMWAWGAGLDIPGEDPTALLNKWIPGLARVKKPKEGDTPHSAQKKPTGARRGRKKAQTTLLEGLSETPNPTKEQL